MTQRPAAIQAKELLSRASLRLNTADPVREQSVSQVLDESLALPAGAQVYRTQPDVFAPNFAETSADNLAFVFNPVSPQAPASDRLERSTHVMRRLVHDYFGPDALYWLDGRTEPVRGGNRRVLTWGARLGAGFDRDGLMESLVTYEWGPSLMDALPAPLYNIAKAVMEALPGLRPAFSTIRCGRSAGSQQVTFEMDYPLALQSLKPMMDLVGLGGQHASLMSTCAFLLGARFTLPPGTATLTLRPARDGVELRLDINLDALADTPPQLVSLLHLQLAERPKSLRALDRWLTAMTPEHYDSPGSVSVLSIRVMPDMPARVALYIRPAAITGLPVEETGPFVEQTAPPALVPLPPASGTGFRR